MKKWGFVLLLFFSLVSLALAVGDGNLHIYFLDVGQGDATLIIGPNGASCIIDGGPSNDTTPYEAAMNDAISRGLTDSTLDYIMVTHFHADHLTALDEFHALYSGGLVYSYDRGGSYSSGAFTDYDNYFGSSGLKKRRDGETFYLDSAAMTYLGRGGSGTSSDENNNGIVYRLDFLDFQCFFGGDLEDQPYEPPKGLAAGDCDLYQVDHHGSRNASLTDFLNYIQPEAHVFSYGVGNSYGHPHQEAIDRLNAVGSYRFDTPLDNYHGDPFVYCITDGVSYFEVNGVDFSLGGTPTPTQTVTPTPTPTPTPEADLFFNEIHYDNVGADANEGVEIAGPAGINLSGWAVYAYNGYYGTVYDTINLSGDIPNQGNGYGTVWVSITGLQNGDSAPDGIALVNPSSEVVQFLSYEGKFKATDGPADGITSEDIGITESGETPLNYSLQLSGSGTIYSDFTWQTEAPHTRGDINNNQTFSGGPTPTPTETPIPTPTPTPSLDIYVYDIAMIKSSAGVNNLATATVWIKDDESANVAGATVYGDWSGIVSGSSEGITGTDGKAAIDSPKTKNDGAFTFCVTDVIASGYTYNETKNIETCDSTGSGPTPTPTPTSTETPTPTPTPTPTSTPGEGPDAPSDLQAEVVSITLIDLTWVDNSNDEDNFILESKKSVLSTWEVVATLPANLTSFSDTSVRKGTTYDYRVKATNTLGESAYSNIVTVTTPKK